MDSTPLSSTPAPPKAAPKRGHVPQYKLLFTEPKQVLQFDFMDGFRAEVVKGVTPSLLITHGFMLGSNYFPQQIGNSVYNLSIDVMKRTARVNATLDSMWHINGVVHGFLRPNLMGTLQMQTSRNPAEDRVVGELAYTGPDYTLNADVMVGRHVGFSYSQYVNKDWTMGLEAKYQLLDRDLSYAVSAKYDVGSNLIGGTISNQRILEAYYLKRASKRTKVVSMLRMDFENWKSELDVGCMYTFKSGKMHMSLNSSGILQSYIEEYVSRSIIMTLGIMHNIPTKQSSIGFSTKLILGI